MDFDHRPLRGEKLQPLDEISGYKVRPGFYDRNGAAQAADGVSFTIHSMGATGCTLLLFRPKEQEPFAKIRYPETYCIGSTYSMLVFGLNIEEFEYAFQLDGPYDEKKGLRFHKDNILLDPYARAVTGQRHWGERPEGGKDFVYHARVVENNFDWEKSCFLNHPFEDLVIYEMHVRGFTRDASSGVKAPGTFEGLREKIPYLKDLGINAVELMPVFEFDEMEDTRVVDGERLYNYWGYNTVCFFAPNTSYTSVVEHNHEGDELKNLIYEERYNGMKKTVLITGASRGIGRAIAVAFAKAGYNLVITCSKSETELLHLKNDLERDYSVDVLASIGDISDFEYVTQLFSHIEQRFHGVDVLVNNAGISYVGLLTDMTIDEWNHILGVNLTSVFSTCKLAIPHMLSRKSGKIINISSVWGNVGASCEVAYSACKGGMNSFTRGLAKELAPSNIQVNAIACGCIDTQMNACFSEEERATLTDEIPAGRFGMPEEVASLVLTLAEGNEYLTGQIITLDGGWI